MSNELNILKQYESALDVIVVKMEGINKQLVAASENARKFTSTMPKGTSGGANASSTAAATATKKLTILQQEEVKVKKQLYRAHQQLIVAQTSYSKKLAAVRVDLREQNKLNREDAILKSKLTSAYQKIVVKMNRAAKAYRDYVVIQANGVRLSKQQHKAMAKAKTDFQRLEKAVLKADKAINRHQRNVGNYSSALGKLGGKMSTVFAAFGITGGLFFFADAIKDAFSLTKTLDSMAFSMKAVITDSEELAKTTDFLAKISQDYGADLVTVTNRYIKFRAATQQAGLTAKETQKIFGTMTKAAGVLGLKKDELQGIFLALEQMVSKGKITTEELRRQLGERLPGAMDIMANSMGVTTAELDKMLKKGEVITKDVLPAFAEQVEIAYGLDTVDKVETLQAATTRLGNAWTLLIQDFNDSGEASGFLMKVFDSLANNLGTIVKSIGYAAVAFVAYKAIVVATMVQSSLLSKVWWGNTIALGQLQLGAIRAAFSMKALGTALKSNIILLAISVIVGLVIAFNDWGKSALELSKALNKSTKKTLEQADATRVLDIETTNLLTRYDELKKKTILSNKEQKELKDIIVAIGKAFPQATISVDEYGRAIEISGKKAKELVESNKELAKLDAQIAIRDQTSNLKRLSKEQAAFNKLKIDGSEGEIDGIGKVIRKGENLLVITNKRSGATRDLTEEEQKAYIIRDQNLKKEIKLSEDLLKSAQDIVNSYDPLNMRLKLQAEELERITKAMEKNEEKKSTLVEGTVAWYRKTISNMKLEIEAMSERNKISNKQIEIKKKQLELNALLGVSSKKSVKEVKELDRFSLGYWEKLKGELEATKMFAFDNGQFEEIEAKLKIIDDAIRAIKEGADFDVFEALNEDLQDADLAEGVQNLLNSGIDVGMNILSGETGQDLSSLFAEFNDLYEWDYQNFLKFAKKKTKDAEIEAQKKKDLEQKVYDLSSKLAGELGDMLNTMFDRKIQRIDDDIEKNRDYYAEILDNENLTQEQRLAIEAERDVKERKLEKEKRKREAQAIRVKKAFSATEIIINTAREISEVSSNPLLVALTAAIGAAQLVTVLSTPVPQYAEGKGNYDNYEGMAVWGERNREAKVGSDGSIELSPRRIGNHITHVKSDDIIHPDANKFLRTLTNEEINTGSYNFISDSTSANYNDLAMKQAVASQTVALVGAMERNRARVNVSTNINLGEDIKYALKGDF